MTILLVLCTFASLIAITISWVALKGILRLTEVMDTRLHVGQLRTRGSKSTFMHEGDYIIVLRLWYASLHGSKTLMVDYEEVYPDHRNVVRRTPAEIFCEQVPHVIVNPPAQFRTIC